MRIVPCGKCIGCKLDKSRDWADRMILELDHHNGKAIFLTLTYDNEHVPMCENDDGIVGYTLFKPDWQLFAKRLREHFEPRRLRFFCAGEYGSSTFRPHLHAIIFGIDLNDISDLSYIGESLATDISSGSYFTSDVIRRIWRNGNIVISPATYKTMAYVARYVLKKQYGDDKQIYIDRGDCLPEFTLMSRRPGISGFYLIDHPDCIDKSKISVYDNNGAIDVRLPKYLLHCALNNGNTDIKSILDQRRKFAESKTALVLSKTDLSYVEYLEQEEERKLKHIVSLHRILDKEL